MTTLSLTVLCHPEHGSSSQRVVQSGELTLGRDAECDWALPDPMKSLSRKHCRLVCASGSWQVQDLSTNGTFINSALEPIGRNAAQVLRDGDRLRLGDYVIEVRVAERAAPPPRSGSRPGPSSAPGPLLAEVRLPGLDDASRDRPGGGEPGAIPDHTPSSSNAFEPPRVLAGNKAIVPDDWLNARAHGSGPVMPPPHEPAVLPTPPVATPGGDLNGALAALIAGGNLPPEFAVRAAEDPERVLRNAGALLSAAVSGVRALLIARGMVKREFRIEQTTLKRENNPLKFAASDDQALAALLDPRARALEAMQESIEDLASHQVAVLAATQSAARALLQRLDPSVLEADHPGSGKFLDSREKRLWEAYRRRHAKLLEQFEDDFESAFGTAFARAYEQAVRKGKD